MREIISVENFHIATRCLLGLPVSRAVRTIGSAILIDFNTAYGEKDDLQRKKASVLIEWSWRAEKLKSVWFGSFSGKQKIENGLQALVGREVTDIAVEGRLPELVVALSGGVWVHSFTTVEGQPEWVLYLPDGRCIFSKVGRLECETAQ